MSTTPPSIPLPPTPSPTSPEPEPEPLPIRLALNEMTSIEVVLNPLTHRVVKRLATSPDVWSPAKLLANEKAIYERLGPDPPGILKCYNPKSDEGKEGEIELEWAYYRDLWSFLYENQDIELGKRLEWCRTLTSAIGFCHKKNIAVIDIHPRNVLLTHDLQAKLSDFGYSSLDFSYSPGKTHSAYSAHYYHPHDRRLEDLMALGHLFYFILHNAHPYEEWEEERIVESYRGQVYPPLGRGVMRGLKEVMRASWDGDYQRAEDVERDLEEVVKAIQEEEKKTGKSILKETPEWIPRGKPPFSELHPVPSSTAAALHDPHVEGAENESSDSEDDHVVFMAPNGNLRKRKGKDSGIALEGGTRERRSWEGQTDLSWLEGVRGVGMREDGGKEMGNPTTTTDPSPALHPEDRSFRRTRSLDSQTSRPPKARHEVTSLPEPITLSREKRITKPSLGIPDFDPPGNSTTTPPNSPTGLSDTTTLPNSPDLEMGAVALERIWANDGIVRENEVGERKVQTTMEDIGASRGMFQNTRKKVRRWWKFVVGQ